MRKLATLTILLSTPAFAANPPYTFTNLADSIGPFSTFNTMAINNLGQVAFKANLDSGSQGIYVASRSSAATPVAIKGGGIAGAGTFSSFDNELDINNSGTVVFGGITSAFSDIAALGSTTTSPFLVSTTTSPIAGRSINNGGFASFIGGASGNTVIVTNGSSTTNVATSSPGFFIANGLASTSINDNGAVVFLAATAAGTGIYSNASGTPALLLDTTGPFKAFSFVAENNAGLVAFNADLDDGSHGIFTVDTAGNVSTIASSTAGNFKSFPAPSSINDSGNVLFLATDANSHTGLYTGPNPVSDKVLAFGDPLFGSTVSSLATFSQSLNNSAQVALRVTLANNNSYIVLASPASPGDANADGHIDLSDLAAVLNNFGKTNPTWAAGNFDSQPTIDLTDLAYVLNNFGATNPSLPAAASQLPNSAPEPTTLTFSLLTIPFLLRRKLQRRP